MSAAAAAEPAEPSEAAEPAEPAGGAEPAEAAAGANRLVLAAGGARLELSPADGGRIASLRIDGRELLRTEGYGPIEWGAYPMAPFAGRIREGAFPFRGRDIRLPINLPPHAIHGTVFVRAWDVVAATPARATLVTDLGPDWPFAGRVEQRIAISEDRLDASLTLTAAEPMPAALGWHPWFLRRIGGPTTPPVALAFEAAEMLVRGPDGIPTGARIPPPPGPWDDAFTGLTGPPRLTWPGQLELTVASPAAWWVVYDGRDDAIAVEPQTAPPDFVRIEPVVVEPDEPLVATMTWTWRRLG